MPCKTFAALIVSPLLLSMPLAAQETTPDPIDDIVVEGVREREQAVETTARAITRRQRVDKPLAKFYAPICIGVFGMQPDYARTMIARMEDVASELDLPIGGEDCKVNVMVGFVRGDARDLDRLRAEEPDLFATLKDYEFDRIKRGNGAVQAWHGTEVKDVDGQPFQGALLQTLQYGPPRSVAKSTPFSGARLGGQIRVDMTGAMVLIDAERTPGKTLQQLADYAAMRAFASIDDLSTGEGFHLPTILSLFADDHEPPGALTTFDRAYLEAAYALPPSASDSQIFDATWVRYRRLADHQEPDGDQ